MIILDISKCKKSSLWPDNMPKKIRLIEGQHFKQYDVHPMCRQTKWYKKLHQNSCKKYPFKFQSMPIGIDNADLPFDARIISVRGQK